MPFDVRSLMFGIVTVLVVFLIIADIAEVEEETGYVTALLLTFYILKNELCVTCLLIKDSRLHVIVCNLYTYHFFLR